jgi:GNAT superfamily N-acetyltransferase
VAYAEGWYGERGLVPRFQLPVPDADPLSGELAGRGWAVADSADVMVGDVSTALELLPAPATALPPVELSDAPSAGWLDGYHYRGGPLPPAGRAVLTNHSNVSFASVVDHGRTVAIARGAVDGPWLGFSAVEVMESERRRGLARHTLGALLRWGRNQGARYAHLQVEIGNSAGRALYTGLGFAFHHRYDYRVRQ